MSYKLKVMKTTHYVIGDTKSIKDQLKELGGRFNFRLSCGAGWIFPKTKEEQIKAVLSGEVLTVEQAEPNNPTMEEYLTEIKKHWHDEQMIKHFANLNSGLYRLSNGGIFPFESLKIQKDFCFGYSDSAYDTESYDNANNMAHHASTNEKYFIDNNIGWYKKFTERLKDGRYKMYLQRQSWSGGDKLNLFKPIFLDFVDAEEYKGELIEATTQDIEIIKNAYKKELDKFNKRLQSYLKRYGLSKVNAWSYWADR